MKISVYVPKNLEEPLQNRAAEAGISPSIFLQSLLKERLERGEQGFSDAFAALAGSWEDTRPASEIVREVEAARESAHRPALR